MKKMASTSGQVAPSSISRLPQPSQLRAPGSTVKRCNRDSLEDITQSAKKPRFSDSSKASIASLEGNLMPCPAKRPPIGKVRNTVGKLRRSVSMATIPAPNRTSMRFGLKTGFANSTNPGAPKSNFTTRSSSVTASMIQKNKVSTTTGASKRPPWDLKGRLMDMEERLKLNSAKYSDYDSRISSLETEKTTLSLNLQETKSYSAGAEEEISKLKEDLRNEKEERYSEKSLLERKLCDSEFKISNQERLITTLKFELDSKTEELSHLKSSVSMLMNTKISMEEEITATKVALEEITLKSNEFQMLTEKQALLIKEMSSKLMDGEELRKKLHNAVQELKGNIRVFCRVRPLIGEEIERNGSNIIHHINFLDERSLELIKNTNLDGSSMSGIRNRSNNPEFIFDHVFTPNDTQADVYDEISQLAQSALDGYNVCVFAYGQTGSGKTFTMEGVYGDENKEGIIPRTVKHIINSIEELKDKGWSYKLEASFLEIYNETIRDLLATTRDHKNLTYDIKLVEGKKSDIYISNLKVVPVESVNEIHNLLDIAQKHRVVASTNVNERSSRSHSVFQLKIKGKNLKTSSNTEGILNLIDLAGSERLKESLSEGLRLTETQSINKSLANLGNVIMALAQKQSHIPYRNSKLTHLLQNCLGGNSKTLMFINVSPLDTYFNETLNSLRFATKVNQCHIGTAVKQHVKK